jgi:hypothetical protein
MRPGMDTIQVRKDTTNGTHHIRAILKLADNLRGDYYIARNEKDNAIASLTKALTIRDNPDTRKKLDDLKAHN